MMSCSWEHILTCMLTLVIVYAIISHQSDYQLVLVAPNWKSWQADNTNKSFQWFCCTKPSLSQRSINSNIMSCVCMHASICVSMLYYTALYSILFEITISPSVSSCCGNAICTRFPAHLTNSKTPLLSCSGWHRHTMYWEKLDRQHSQSCSGAKALCLEETEQNRALD